MDIGTGLTLLGIWYAYGQSVRSSSISSEAQALTYWTSVIFTIGFGILSAINFGN